MTQNIFELDPDVLVLVADGTYCKIQIILLKPIKNSPTSQNHVSN
jgi:hypothetical protein